MATSKKDAIKNASVERIQRTDLQRTETQIKSDVGVAGCFLENAGELVQAFDSKFYDVDAGKVKIDGDDAIQLTRLIWSKVEESYSECLGKTVEIEFGDSASANLLETVVKFIIKN